MARYVLMNKNTKVLLFEYDLEEHNVVRIEEVFNSQAAPFGLFDERGNVSKRSMNYWWRHRAIPSSRDQIDRVLMSLQLESTLELAERNFGLSLTDCYWIDDVDAPQKWADINFFDNDFSDDLGFLTLGQDSGATTGRLDYASLNLVSPNSTLGGDLLKKWKIIDGKRVLLKSGVGLANQEPYNEIIATKLHSLALEPADYVEYRLFTEGRRVYSACENMLGPDEELVAAWDLIRSRKQKNSESDLMFFVHCCEEQGLENVMEFLAKMFACDYVLANRDRHWRNFGIVRNVETLQATRMAPIFDTGGCLWSDMVELELPVDFAYKAKPFKYDGIRPYDQLQLFVGHLGWLDASRLDGFPDQVGEVLRSNPNIPPARIDKIVVRVRKNCEDLAAVARRG